MKKNTYLLFLLAALAFSACTDLGETNNIAEQHPGKVAELDAFAKQAHKTDMQWPLFASEQE